MYGQMLGLFVGSDGKGIKYFYIMMLDPERFVLVVFEPGIILPDL